MAFILDRRKKNNLYPLLCVLAPLAKHYKVPVFGGGKAVCISRPASVETISSLFRCKVKQTPYLSEVEEYCEQLVLAS